MIISENVTENLEILSAVATNALARKRKKERNDSYYEINKKQILEKRRETYKIKRLSHLKSSETQLFSSSETKHQEQLQVQRRRERKKLYSKKYRDMVKQLRMSTAVSSVVINQASAPVSLFIMP